MTPRSKTALFAGSFDPFTLGHLRIVERALGIADKVIVAVGVNINKPGAEADAGKRMDRIAKAVSGFNTPDEPGKVSVCSYSGLTADFAKETGADFLVRGVRNISDFEYERNLADINLKILGMETVFLCAEPEYSYISSSAVRELKANGFDVTPLLP